uniref:uncharacterized protein LOC120889651 n=1 Tax=Ictidomys tridecemlineatus TaxID=43179 RepID=UPI001A9DA43E|nr:uncharacterized protein LOC120889651 [Ictidomys tridecemlineatus]
MPQEGDGRGGWARQESSKSNQGLGGEKEAQKGRQRGEVMPSGFLWWGPHAPGPTQGTGNPSASDGERDHAAALRILPLLRSPTHTKKEPEELSLRLRRFLVQVRRKQTQARPRNRGGRHAPSPPPGLGPGPHLLPGAAAAPQPRKGGSPPTTRSRTPGRFCCFFKRRSSLGRRRRGYRLLPPRLLQLPHATDRGHSAGAKL